MVCDWFSYWIIITIRVCLKWFQIYIMLVKIGMLFFTKIVSGRCEYVVLHSHSWVKTIQCTIHGTGQGVYIFETKLPIKCMRYLIILHFLLHLFRPNKTIVKRKLKTYYQIKTNCLEYCKAFPSLNEVYDNLV